MYHEITSTDDERIGKEVCAYESHTSYAVKVNADGTYTISGLQKDDNGIYEMYSTKNQNEQVIITKVWGDGVSNTDPNKDLIVTIQTDVPEASNRIYTVIYDANGGNYGTSGE